MKLNYLAAFFLIIFNYQLKAEGTKQVMPNNTNGSALHIWPQVGFGNYRGALTENRINFNIKDHTVENFYFGLKPYMRQPSAGIPTNTYYRILNPSGTQVVAPTLLPTSSSFAGIGSTNAGTSGTITDAANAYDADNTTYSILNDNNSTQDIRLQHVVPSGTTITIRLGRDAGSGTNAVGSIFQSIDDVTYTNSQAYSTSNTDPTGTGISYTLTADAEYIRIRKTNTNGSRDTRIHYIEYSFTLAQNGLIESYTEAITGPNINGLTPAGYRPITFDPTVNGDYSIELYRSVDGGVTADLAGNGEVYFPWFDFTVSRANNTQYPGRVHCQKWALITYNPADPNFLIQINNSFEGSYHGYTSDSTVLRINFSSGFRPLGFTVAMNNYGVANTGNFVVDRVSVHTGSTQPSFLGGYKVFLDVPDTSVYKISEQAAQPTLFSNIYGCPGAYFIPFYIDAAGDVAILLDLNGVAGYQAGTSDRVLEAYDRAAGNNVMTWNGLDGLGAVVSDAISISITATVLRGRTNIPMYDAELNSNGFTVTSVYPATGSRRLFWDDSSLGNVGDCSLANAHNNTGAGVANTNPLAGALGPTHGWDGPGANNSVPAPTGGGGSTTLTDFCDDFGNARTINTWFWADDVSSTPTLKQMPTCDDDGDGISNFDDIDDDNDGITDIAECGADPLLDHDGDNTPNFLDPQFPGFVDVNRDGVHDLYDKDLDGVINAYDLDSDNDGLPDIIEGGGTDTNNDGRADDIGGGFKDFNENGLADQYDPACTGGNVTGRGDASAGTSGSITNAARAYDNNAGNYSVLNDNGSTQDIELQDIVYAGVTLSVNLGSNTLLSNASGTIYQSVDDVTYINPQNYTVFSTTSTTVNYTLTETANYIRIVKTNASGSPDTRVYIINYTYNLCTGTTGTAPTLPDTDADGVPNYLDIDSDNDGIPDLIETQTTAGFRSRLNADNDGDGWDDRFDQNSGGTVITPTDTDGDGTPDWLDSDSDNDGFSDRIEGWDTNLDRVAEVVFNATDTDGDGLVNVYDPTPTVLGSPSASGKTPQSFPNTWHPSSSERDWRDPVENPFNLPITLIDFKAIKVNSEVKTYWSTSAEINNHYFTVERSSDVRNWEAIGTEKGAGNSNQILEYDFWDKKPLNGISYYRLKQTDFDGKFSYSDVASVNFSSSNLNDAIKVFPNPAGNIVNILSESPITQYELYEFGGKLLLSKDGMDETLINIDLSGYNSGVFFIKVISEGKITTKRIVKN